MASRRKPPSKGRPSKGGLSKGRLSKGRPSTGVPGEGGPSSERPGITPATSGLGNIRNSIDAVDARIHALLNERARFAQLVGISKSASGKAVDFFRPGAEA